MSEAQVSIAFVRFCAEKKGFVVDKDDIEDFDPQHVEDFSKEKKYKVKWPILKRQDSMSSTTDETYPAHIIMLAVDAKSMIHRAAAARVRLPAAFLTAHQVEKPAKRHKREDGKELLKHSKKSKKDIDDAVAKEAKKRMLAIAAKHSGGNIITPEKPASSSTDSHKNKPSVDNKDTSLHDKPASIIKERLVGPKETVKVLSSNILNTHTHKTRSSKDENVSLDVNADVNARMSSSPPAIEFHESPPADHHYSDVKSSTEWDSVVASNNIATIHGDTSESGNPSDDDLKSDKVHSVAKSESGSEMTVAVKVSKKKRNDLSESDSSSASSMSIVLSDKKVELPDRNQTLCEQLGKEQRKCRRLITELTSKDLLLSRWKDAFQNLMKTGSQICQDETELNEMTPSKMFPHSSPRVNQWVATLPSSPQHKPSAVKTLFKDDSAEIQSKGSSKPFPLLFQSGASKTMHKLNSPRKSHKKSPHKHSPRKTSFKVKTKSKGVKKPDQTLGPHEKMNDDLAPMILEALTGNRPLQGDGKGNVHIGNNVYISESNWDDSIAPPSIAISIAIKNLVGAIYSVKEGARLSVTGGVSPKTNAAAKAAVPLGTLQAIYAVYRAKMMMEGVTSNRILDKSVDDCAKKYVRERLSEMSKTVQREEKKISLLKESKGKK